MKHTHIITLIALCLTAVQPVLAQVRDKEQVIDVLSLSQAIDQATKPIVTRMSESRLGDRFADVNKLLEAKEVDKQQLIDSLKALKSEMDAFTTNWHETTDPLWKAQDSIAQTADRVRLLLADGPRGQASEKTKKLLMSYDTRLAHLANYIKAEPDQQRRAHMKQIFGNVLVLRKLTEQAGNINIDPAREGVYMKILGALDGLENQLTEASFQVEQARVVLSSQSEFIGRYVDVLEGLVDAESLAKMLGNMKTSGSGFGNLAVNLDQLAKQSQQFTTGIDGLASKLADSIEAESAHAAAKLDTSSQLQGLNIDMDAEINRYATPKTPPHEHSVNPQPIHMPANNHKDPQP